ncbi:hypothetical protein Tco_0923194 [Tanacetum coccineum]|uniref:Uncharacterized protein n=1 Tax=Tanacetum coccineum TaxID=301880 RepID=A0ABQ5D0B0_9ASTR
MKSCAYASECTVKGSIAKYDDLKTMKSYADVILITIDLPHAKDVKLKLEPEGQQHSTTIVFENKDEQDEKADVDFGDIDFSKLNMGGGDGLDAEGNEDDSDIEEEAKEEEAIGKQEVVPPVSNQVDIIYSQY